MFTLAHLTDIHLSPLPPVRARQILGLRLPGYLNWIMGRGLIHNRETLDRLTADIKARNPDHIAVTGDLVNISLPLEFVLAAEWLRQLGPSDHVTVVPGNHDAYVRLPPKRGLDHWSAYMASDQAGAEFVLPARSGFPFVRIVDPVVLIGLSSACPTWPFMATGRLGKSQIEAFRSVLERLKGQNLFKIVLLHHPPLPGMASWRRKLDDAPALQDVLRQTAPDLVLHGHDHQVSQLNLECPGGPVPIIGAPSASVGQEGIWQLAAYFVFEISRLAGGWSCEMSIRGLKVPGGQVEELHRATIIG